MIRAYELQRSLAPAFCTMLLDCCSDVLRSLHDAVHVFLPVCMPVMCGLWDGDPLPGGLNLQASRWLPVLL